MKIYLYYLKLYEEYLKGLGYKEGVIYSSRLTLKRLFEFLKTKKKYDVRDVTEKDIYDFAEYMMQQETKQKKLFSRFSVSRMIARIKNFYGYLLRNNIILLNPIEQLIFNSKDVKRKKEILSYEEISKFLESIDIDTPCTQRDRAIYELMYSSALRVSEIVNLNIGDVDLKERILAVRKGKGDKDRYVPFSEVADRFLKKYLSDARKHFLKKLNQECEKIVFLNEKGKLKTRYVRDRFNRYLEKLSMKKEGLTLHSIRHSTATHLLEAGVDVRYVAELLGHEDIETTVKYTHLKIESLKRIYKSMHPRENKYYDEIDDEYLENIELLKEKLKENKIRYHRYGRVKNVDRSG